ncbi:MAG: kynurenine 3-monooxygenase [Actinomycetales bacterium mxb001]|nr:MAG: kynurenine 3-monooxygenase [Actinomycetales bacterium mxb001]
MSQRVAIVGAGLTGALLATMLGRRGYDVAVYERRSDPRATGAERGRSINLAISTRGLTALRHVGLEERVLARGLLMKGRMIHAVDGEQEYQPYSADGEHGINSISRGELNAVLLDAAEELPNVTLRFDHRLTALDIDTREMTFAAPEGTVDVSADAIIGSDGAFSVVRRAMQSRDGFDYSQDYLSHSYKELTIPAVDGDFALDPGALHIWPRGASMMIALPNLDKSFTATLFWPRKGPASFEDIDTPEKARRYFDDNYPDASELMPNLEEDYRLHPIGSLLTVRCAPWNAGGVALIGDAAHAIVPFYGQGANAGFEDCIELVQQLELHAGNWEPALAAYASIRKPQGDAIADLALHNFIEMRDLVSTPSYQIVHRTEQLLNRALGDRYKTRYEMVSFSTTPYAEIEPTVRKQRTVVGVATAVGLAALAAVGLSARKR